MRKEKAMAQQIFRLCPIYPLVRINAICSAHFGIRQVGYSYDGESHDFWEAVFVLRGEGSVTAGERVYNISAGDVIFHPPGEFHRLTNCGEVSLRIAVISFSADFFPIDKHKIYKLGEEHNPFAVIHSIRRLFETDGIFLVKPHKHATTAEIQEAVAALEGLFLKLFAYEDDRSVPHVEGSKSAALYSEAVRFMRHNLDKRLSREEIAEACGVSVSTIQKLFFKYTGLGIMRYYETMIMKRADELLAAGYQVKEVSIALGYSDPNYFSTAYKRYNGYSPRTTLKKV